MSKKKPLAKTKEFPPGYVMYIARVESSWVDKEPPKAVVLKVPVSRALPGGLYAVERCQGSGYSTRMSPDRLSLTPLEALRRLVAPALEKIASASAEFNAINKAIEEHESAERKR